VPELKRFSKERQRFAALSVANIASGQKSLTLASPPGTLTRADRIAAPVLKTSRIRMHSERTVRTKRSAIPFASGA